MNHIQQYPHAFNQEQCEYYIHKYKKNSNKDNWTGFYTGITIDELVPIDDKIKEYENKFPQLKSIRHRQYQYKNIQHYQPNQCYSIPHIEHQYYTEDMSLYRVLVWMINLNTVTDQGGTYFPEQNTMIQPIQGNLSIWPAKFPYVHHGVNSPTQHKFILTGWNVLSDVSSSSNHNG